MNPRAFVSIRTQRGSIMSLLLMSCFGLTCLVSGTALLLPEPELCACDWTGEWDGSTFINIECTEETDCNGDCWTQAPDDDTDNNYCWCEDMEQNNCECTTVMKVSTGAAQCASLYGCNNAECDNQANHASGLTIGNRYRLCNCFW